MPAPSQRSVRLELAAMTALLLSYIWLWQDTFPGDRLVCYALFAAIGFQSHWRRGERPADVGFRLDNLGRGLGQALVFVGPLIVATLLVGLWLDSWQRPTGPWPGRVAVRVVWGTAQQYGLLAFYYLRLRDLLSRNWAATVAAAGLFALFHLPNPFLVAVTLAAGALSCWLYRRVPNLWALGLAHGLLSTALGLALPHALTMGLRVGPGYGRFLERLLGGGADVHDVLHMMQLLHYWFIILFMNMPKIIFCGLYIAHSAKSA